MRNVVNILLFTFFTGIASAQSTELKWYTSVEEAVKISQKQKKPMMLFFTGSDWCGWCVKLQKEVFNQPEFKTWAAANVVLVEVDFPRNKVQTAELKTQNQTLQRQFGIQGYPTVWFVRPEKMSDGKVNFVQLGSSGYRDGGAKNWIEQVTPYLKK